ncbi:hypothetical protein [Halopolyspora algeriensis]
MPADLVRFGQFGFGGQPNAVGVLVLQDRRAQLARACDERIG